MRDWWLMEWAPPYVPPAPWHVVLGRNLAVVALERVVDLYQDLLAEREVLYQEIADLRVRLIGKARSP